MNSEDNNNKKTINVAYPDGTRRWMTPDEFDDMVEEYNQYNADKHFDVGAPSYLLCDTCWNMKCEGHHSVYKR
jgi:hypothetical protein